LFLLLFCNNYFILIVFRGRWRRLNFGLLASLVWSCLACDRIMVVIIIVVFIERSNIWFAYLNTDFILTLCKRIIQFLDWFYDEFLVCAMWKYFEILGLGIGLQIVFFVSIWFNVGARSFIYVFSDTLRFFWRLALLFKIYCLVIRL
jgi:hypothetical protein